MLGGDDLLYEEILDYCEHNYKIMKALLDYFYNRLEEEMKEGK
jgi:hypothetical protein